MKKETMWSFMAQCNNNKMRGLTCYSDIEAIFNRFERLRPSIAEKWFVKHDNWELFNIEDIIQDRIIWVLLPPKDYTDEKYKNGFYWVEKGRDVLHLGCPNWPECDDEGCGEW